MSFLPSHRPKTSKRSHTKDALQGNMISEDHVRSKRCKYLCEEKVELSSTISKTFDELPHHGRLPSHKRVTSLDKSIITVSSHWSLRHAFNGYISNIDPVFSADENYVFLSLGSMIQVFSLPTSQPFRCLQMKDLSNIVDFRLCSYHPEYLYVLASSGTLVQWDWASNKQLAVWERQKRAISFDIVSVKVEERAFMVSFFLCDTNDGCRQISISRLNDTSSNRLSEFVVFETSKLISMLKILQLGRILIACDGQYVIIGSSNIPVGEQDDPPVYTWREIRLPVKVTSIDVREHSITSETSAERTDSRLAPVAIDLAFGESNGSILIYYDIMNALHQNERAGWNELKCLPLLRKLHWHREAVASLRWLGDGNYIISGGRESVIVFWQLDSSRKHFLPHFSSPICNMTISQSGKLYAAKLLDNSLVVLSATELEEFATVTGLQLPLWARKMKHTGPDDLGELVCRPIPALLHPQRADSLLIPVPSRQSTSQQDCRHGNLSVLQTFDIRTGSHISRQALSRTNITVLNKGPDGATILSPDIEHLDISTDGKWLVTVDTWSPHHADLNALESFPLHSASERQCYREIYLKFWKWNSSTEAWELVTSIDSPHFQIGHGSVPLHCLASRPGCHGFATFGSDDILRYWEPAARNHSTIKSEASGSRLEQTWKCQSVVDFTGSPGVGCGKSSTSASMSFSEDGSVLAICIQDVVHLVDTHRWDICKTRGGLLLKGIFSLKFLGRHVIIASRMLMAIWDTVDDNLRVIPIPGLDPVYGPNNCEALLLAVNSKSRTFATVIHCLVPGNAKSTKKRRKVSSQINVYDLHSCSPLFRSDLESPLCLLSNLATGDYIVVDTTANVTRLSCRDEDIQLSSVSSYSNTHLMASLENIFGKRDQGLFESTHNTDKETSKPLSRKLGDIFGRAPPLSLPPVNSLFKDVVGSLVTTS